MNPPKTSKELANAIYDDFKRQAIDAAKKRAVSQNVDYETFKNMVSVAHLKPLQAPNTAKSGASAPSWSFNPDGTRASALGDGGDAAAAGALGTFPQSAPSTSGDFTRDWRRCCPTQDDKYRLLHLCGPEGLRVVFKLEVPSELLKEMVAVLEACWMGHAGVAEGEAGGGALVEAAFVVEVLRALSSAGRFSLAVRLTGAATKQALESLFTQLAGAVQASQAATQAAADDEAGQSAGSAVASPASEAAAQGQGAATGSSSSAAGGSSSGAAISPEALLQLRQAYGLKA